MAANFKRSAIALLIFFLASVSAAGAEDRALNDQAVVTIVDGSAQLFTQETTKGKPLAKGDQVVRDNAIQVGANSRVELRLPDGSFLRLAQKTRITINQLEFDGTTTRKNFQVDLVVGKLWAKVKKLLTPDSAVSVRTQTMVLGVRGTAFNVDVSADKSGQLKVYEGEVAAGPKTQDAAVARTIVKAGQQLKVSSRGIISKPRSFDPKAETSDWSRWNQERDRLVDQEPESAKPSEGAGSPSTASPAAGIAPVPGAAGPSPAPAAGAAPGAAVAAAAAVAGEAGTATVKPGTATIQAAGESTVVVEIPRTQWCQCVRGLLNVEGGNAGACVKSGVSEDKLKIFRQRGTGGERSNSVSFLLSFAGCAESENENVGSLSFNVQWQGQANKGTRNPEQAAAPITCEAGGITAVEATLYRSSNAKIAAATPWNCAKPVGMLHHIPVDTNIRFIVTGKNAAGAVLYRGERAGITIAYAKTTALGVLMAPAFTPVLLTPGEGALLGNGHVDFTWTSPPGATKYQIQVSDTANFASTIVDTSTTKASYGTVTNLATGDYFWRVRATDDFDNTSDWSPPGSITVDTDPPINTTREDCINKGAAATNSHAVSLAISAVKKRGGITGYYLSESSKRPEPGKKGWVAISSTASYTADIPYTLGKRDGKKTIFTWFKDALGHVSQVKSGSIVVDTTLIRTTITSHPSLTTSSSSADFTFIANKAGSTFQCRLDDAVDSACTSTTSYQGLAPGTHTFTVKATDAAGNTDQTPPSFTWTIDTTPPHTIITSHPQSVTGMTSASFGFSSTKPESTFTCRLDNGADTACTSPQMYSQLTESSHTFTVQATDQSGNVDPDPPSFMWTISIPFNTVITDHPSNPSDSRDASFSFTSGKKEATFQCQLDNADYSACSSPQVYSGLTEEGHTFSVKAVDAAGNEDPSPARYTWVIMLQEPVSLNDIRIPESPSFTMLGLTADITPPASPHELSMSFLTGFDVNGNLESAMSVDMSPYLLFYAPKDLTLKQYQDSKREQDLSRIQLSFAAAKALSDEDRAVRLGTALRWTIWDDGDFRLDDDLRACLGTVEPGNVNPPEGDRRRLSALSAPVSRTEYCRNESQMKNWNKSAMDVGFATSLIEYDGARGGIQSNGFGLWTSRSFGYGEIDGSKIRSQLTVHARLRMNEMIPNSDETGHHAYHHHDSFTLGAKWRWSDDPHCLFFVQALLVQDKTAGLAEYRSSVVMSIGSELEVAENLWLAFEMAAQGDPSFLTIQLKGAFPESKAMK